MGAGPRIDFTLAPNSDNPFEFTFVDGNDTPIDYTGSTFLLTVKARDSNDEPTGSVLLTLETGSGISGTVADGELNPVFPDEDDGGLPASANGYICDCLRLESGAAVEPMFWGLIDVPEGISAP